MVNTVHSGTYVNLFGVPMGEPKRSPFEATKHLERNSFNHVYPGENKYLGIVNILTSFNKIRTPFISMTELSKNVLYVDKPGATLHFLVPFRSGCPFLKDHSAKETATPGKYLQPFFIYLTENVYTYGDVITNDPLNGKQLRIQTIKDRGYDAEIVQAGELWRYMVALDNGDPEDYFPHEFLEEGTPFMKISSDDSSEFETVLSSITPNPGEALQEYAYTVGDSEFGVRAWATSAATAETFDFDKFEIPSLMHLKGASTDVLNYWTIDEKNRPVGKFWVPVLIEKMAAEIAKMKESKLLYGHGKYYVSNGREKILTGEGFVPQIKKRGNYDVYTDFDQLYTLISNFSEKLFTLRNNIPIGERRVKIRAGKLAYQELRKRFKQYFLTDNPFPVEADHPALIKAQMLTFSPETGLLYKPVPFDSIYFPEQGYVFIEHDPTFDHLYDYLEHPPMAGYGTTSSGMIVVEDVSSGSFTNAIPNGLKDSNMDYKNVTLIKAKTAYEGINYKVGAKVNENLKKVLGIQNGGVVSSFDKTLEIGMWTSGELWVQDPSRCWILEYDPFGVITRHNLLSSFEK